MQRAQHLQDTPCSQPSSAELQDSQPWRSELSADLSAIWTVRSNSNLFQSATFCLQKEKVNDEDEDEQAYKLHKVEFHCQCCQCNRVDILVEASSRGDNAKVKRKSFGSEMDRQDLNGVRNRERRVGNIVCAKEEEQKGDNGAAGSFDVLFSKYCGKNDDKVTEDQYISTVNRSDQGRMPYFSAAMAPPSTQMAFNTCSPKLMPPWDIWSVMPTLCKIRAK